MDHDPRRGASMITTKKPMLTGDNVRKIFDYNPKTGELFWKVRRPPVVPGKVAGCMGGRGYKVVRYNRKTLFQHRVIWLWVHGSWPIQEIDHIDRNKANNRIENLRDVTHAVNRLNTGPRGESGVKGVALVCKNYTARIFDFRLQKVLHLGTFESIEKASDVFKAKHVDIHGIDSQYFDECHVPHPAIVKFVARYIKARSKKLA
jgi:hypothetical protein